MLPPSRGQASLVSDCSVSMSWICSEHKPCCEMQSRARCPAEEVPSAELEKFRISFKVEK